MDELVVLCDEIKEKLTSQEYLDLMNGLQKLHKTPTDNAAFCMEVQKFQYEFNDLRGESRRMGDDYIKSCLQATLNNFIVKYCRTEYDETEETDDTTELHHFRDFSLHENINEIEHRIVIDIITSPVLFKHRQEFLVEYKKLYEGVLTNQKMIEKHLRHERLRRIEKALKIKKSDF